MTKKLRFLIAGVGGVLEPTSISACTDREGAGFPLQYSPGLRPEVVGLMYKYTLVKGFDVYSAGRHLRKTFTLYI